MSICKACPEKAHFREYNSISNVFCSRECQIKYYDIEGKTKRADEGSMSDEDDYQFVPVTRSNVKELKKLEVAEHQRHWISNITDALAQASFTKNWNGRVLYYGDKIVGFASYGESYPDSDTPNHIGIFKVMIDKNYQGKGHGKMLMKFLLDDIKLFSAAHSDYPKCAYLGVNLDNTPAINLYKKLGFKTINVSKEHNEMLLKYIFE